MDFDPVAYLAAKGLRGRPASGGREIVYPCFFDCAEPADSKKRKLYLNVADGFHHCKRCGVSGGSWTLQKHFGDEPRSGTNDDAFMRRRILDSAAQVGIDMLNNNDDVLLYLLNDRGLSAETIVERKLGFVAGGWSLVGTLPEDVTPEQIKSTGLVTREGPNAGKDFFYRHLLIPYLSHGHVIQMRGRAWGDIKGGKYLTGPGEVPRVYNNGSLEGAEEVIITEGEIDCFSGDTEVLTPDGWCRLDEFRAGLVAQYSSNGSLDFVPPQAFITKEGQQMLRLHTARNGGIDLIVTPGHRVLSCRSDGSSPYTHRADERPISIMHHVPRAGFMQGRGIPHSDDEIALLLALSADASVDIRKHDGAQYARFGFVKERKTQRLTAILERLGVLYSSTVNPVGKMSVCFRLPNYLHFTRLMPWSWLAQATLGQREHILAELVHWDGNHVVSRTQTEYSSKHLHNAEWVQALAHTNGFVATIMERSNSLGHWYKVSLLHGKSSSSWQAIRTDQASTQTAYCLQVPSGLLLVRRNRMVAVSGNCIILAQTLGMAPEERARRIGVIAVPGTNAIPEELDDILTDAKRIYIGFDSDEPGKKAAETLKERLGTRARILVLPYEDGRKSDWNEYLLPAQTGHHKHDHPYAGHDWRDVLRLLSSASGKRVFSIAEAGESFRAFRETHDGLQTGFVGLDAALRPGLLPGQVLVALAKTGCLAGDTQLQINRASKGFRISIADLLDHWEGERYASDRSCPTYIQREEDGVVRLARIENAWRSGPKTTFVLTSSTGRTIRATADHPFLTPTGWRKLSELKSGQQVMVNSGRSHAGDTVLEQVTAEDIVTIVEYGVEETYDIEVEDEPHNFMANGFVVHNTGKTLWLCNLAYNMRAVRVLFISLEMTREEVYDRMRRIYLFHHPEQSDRDAERGLANVFVCDENRLGERDIAALVSEFAVEAGEKPDVVFVDYLGYYARGARGNSPYEKTSNAVMQLKAEAKAGRFVIVSPSQVNRGAKEGKPIDLDDARESGQVEETADFLLALYRPDDALANEAVVNNQQPSGKVKLSILKSRHGGKGKVFSLQMDMLTLAIVDDATPASKRAVEHNYLAWRGHDWDDVRRAETRPVQMFLEGLHRAQKP